MLCYDMICCAVLCHAMPCYAMLWFGMVWYGVVLRFGMVWHAVKQYTLLSRPDSGSRALEPCWPRRNKAGSFAEQHILCYPQLRFIHMHQLVRMQYACFELYAVNIDWWICINVCLVCYQEALAFRGDRIQNAKKRRQQPRTYNI